MWSWMTLVVTLITVVFFYFKHAQQYWKRRGYPDLDPSIPFGNAGELFKTKQHIGIFFKSLYNQARARDLKEIGLYFATKPIYFPVDINIIKNILTKDFEYFTDRTIYYNEKDDPLSAHLFTVNGKRWKNLRVKFTPSFSSGKIKAMLTTIIECETHLQELMSKSATTIDVHDVLSRFTIDIIGSVGFGLDFNTFKDDSSPFRVMSKRIFASSTIFARTFSTFYPSLALKLGIRKYPKDVEDFFMKLVADTVEYREKTKFRRSDFIQALIESESLTLKEIAAQCFVFFIAGFETSAATMSFALYELAKNRDVQEMLRNEIEEVLKKYRGKITYEALQEMEYLQQVINESLRKYPPVPALVRKCVKDYIPQNHEYPIEKGTSVTIPVLAIHYDPEFYPVPEKFDPERFNTENKSKRHACTFLPFGDGPRNCIGMRFGLMQTKCGLISMLKNYRFSLSSRTQEPLTYVSNNPILSVAGGIWLHAEKIVSI